MSDIVKKQYK